MKIKKFNEINESVVIYYNNEFFSDTNLEFKKRIDNKEYPYYFNQITYEFLKVPYSKSFYPLTKKGTPINNGQNPYGRIYFLTDEQFDKIFELIDSLGKKMKLMDEQKQTMLQLVPAYINKVFNQD